MRASIILLLAFSLVAFGAASKTLEIYVVDVEGGNATLFVSPAGESLLIDTGNGGAAAARDAGRIMAAMKDAGITDVKDVHYVQTKTPLLTIDSVRDAESRGKTLACEVHDSMGVSNGTTALGNGSHQIFETLSV